MTDKTKRELDKVSVEPAVKARIQEIAKRKDIFDYEVVGLAISSLESHFDEHSEINDSNTPEGGELDHISTREREYLVELLSLLREPNASRERHWREAIKDILQGRIDRRKGAS